MVRWHLAPDVRDRLLGPTGLPLAEWLRDRTATVVKDAPHRAVYRVQLPGLDCHVKHNRMVGWRGRLRELFRPIKARREFAIGVELQARGVPTPRPLGWGSDGNGLRPSASWLVTETVADAVPLLAYLDSTMPTAAARERFDVRRRLALSIASFLARLHAAGVVHHDLHPGNLLLRFDQNGEPLLWLIDLHAVSLRSTCAWPVRRANLVVFNHFFMMRASRADRLRFWHAYRDAAGDAIPATSRRAAVSLDRMTEESNHRFWRARDGRSLEANRYYGRVRSAVVRGHVVCDLDPQTLAPLLADPDEPFRRPGVRLLKDSRSSTVAEFEMAIAGVRRPVIYKRFRVTARGDRWLSLVRRSAARRSWVFGHGLRERDIPTPRPLAVWHRVVHGVPADGYLLCEKVERACDLHEFVHRLAQLPIDVASKELRQRVAVLARLVRRLHRRGLSHRDLKASNVFTVADFGDPRFWFIDLVGVQRHRHIGRRRKVQNLARLNASFLAHPLVTRSVRLRFLRAYLQAGLHGSAGWKLRWRAIAAETEAKRAKNLKSGRPLT